MEYCVVSDDDLGVLVDEVNEKIENGWAPLGGIAIRTRLAESETSAYHYQAMIKPCSEFKEANS